MERNDADWGLQVFAELGKEGVPERLGGREPFGTVDHQGGPHQLDRMPELAPVVPRLIERVERVVVVDVDARLVFPHDRLLRRPPRARPALGVQRRVQRPHELVQVRPGRHGSMRYVGSDCTICAEEVPDAGFQRKVGIEKIASH